MTKVTNVNARPSVSPVWVEAPLKTLEPKLACSLSVPDAVPHVVFTLKNVIGVDFTA